MPRQLSVVKRERTVGMVVFYKLGSKYYLRTRSRLSGERVKKSPDFWNTMIYANRMGIASRLASMAYRKLPSAWRLHDLYRKLTGCAMQLLKEGMNPNLVLRKLDEFLFELGYRADIDYDVIRPSTKTSVRKQIVKPVTLRRFVIYKEIPDLLHCTYPIVRINRTSPVLPGTLLPLRLRSGP